MANVKLGWEAMKTICTAAGVIIVDDDVAVYADVVNDVSIGLKQFDNQFSDRNGEIYCLLLSKHNAEVEANGSSVWAKDHGGREIQLSVYRPWVVSDDATLQ